MSHAKSHVMSLWIFLPVYQGYLAGLVILHVRKIRCYFSIEA